MREGGKRKPDRVTKRKNLAGRKGAPFVRDLGACSPHGKKTALRKKTAIRRRDGKKVSCRADLMAGRERRHGVGKKNWKRKKVGGQPVADFGRGPDGFAEAKAGKKGSRNKGGKKRPLASFTGKTHLS